MKEEANENLLMNNGDPRRTPIYDRLRVKANPPMKPPTAPAQPPRRVPPAPKPQPSDTGDPYLAEARRTKLKVDLHLMNGEVLADVVIIEISRYAISVVGRDNRKICVMKHSLAWLAPATLEEADHDE